MVVHVEIERVGERILLRLEAIGRDLLDVLLHVHRNRNEAERAHRFCVQLTYLRADPQALAIGRRAYRTDAIRDVPKAVVPETERAERRRLEHALLQLGAEVAS